MPNAFNPERESLVIEVCTDWTAFPLPPELPADARRKEFERLLHAEPAAAAELEYIRLPAGFVRKITVTSADWERLKEHFPSALERRPKCRLCSSRYDDSSDLFE